MPTRKPISCQFHAALIACACLLAALASRATADPPSQPAAAGSVKLVRVVPPAPTSERLGRIVAVFARQVAARCPAKVVLQGEAPLTVALAIDPAIGAEGFRIGDRAGAGIEVAGRDELGVLYGLGKLLRTSRYSPDGFAPGTWRGESVPAKPVRGIDFATHFHNFYHDGPVAEIQRYVEELALWGCNRLMVWFDMHHFEGFDDPEAVAFRRRLGAILQPVADLGMSSAFVMVGNEYSKMAHLEGGWPYSEGLFEDMNKVAMLQLYWNREQPVVATLREYAVSEFAPEVAEDVMTMVGILEKNFRGRNRIGADAIQACELAQKVDARLPPGARTSWRWRILDLRALIDKEMHLSKGRLEGDVLRDAFAELTRIYHAGNTLEGWLKPPQVKQGNQ